MLLEELSRLLKDVPEDTSKAIKALFMIQQLQIEEIGQLKEEIAQLRSQLAQNSSNSHKPPSSDGFKKPKRTRSLRKKSNNKAGGQPGHKGSKLNRSEDIDQMIVHPVSECSCCGKDLKDVAVKDYVKRQVFDLPELGLQVTEHQAELKMCSCGTLSQGHFPADVRGEVQYGPRVRGLASYLQNYQLLPYQRSAELLRDVFEVSISEGTLYNISQQGYANLAGFESELKQYLIEQDLLHSDETGLKVQGKTCWLHTTSNREYTHYQVHQNRGKKAMDEIGILPYFTGTIVHDCLRSYFQYEQAQHSVCLAHILRELQALIEQKQDWAGQLSKLLLDMKKSKDRAIDQGKQKVSKATVADYRKQYRQIIKWGQKANPLPPKDYNRPRKRKRTKAQNLLRRLHKYEAEVFRFYTNFEVPFDNNLAERDLRMAKVKQKISGCFRSEIGAHFFARLRSYISTAKKQGINILEALKAIFDPLAEPLFQFNAGLAR
jgi:transposase